MFWRDWKVGCGGFFLVGKICCYVVGWCKKDFDDNWSLEMFGVS